MIEKCGYDFIAKRRNASQSKTFDAKPITLFNFRLPKTLINAYPTAALYARKKTASICLRYI